MPYFRASFRHTFSNGSTVEMTSHPFTAPTWERARELAKAFHYDHEDVRIAVADICELTGHKKEYPPLTEVKNDE